MGHVIGRHGTRYRQAWDTLYAGMGHVIGRPGTRYRQARDTL